MKSLLCYLIFVTIYTNTSTTQVQLVPDSLTQIGLKYHKQGKLDSAIYFLKQSLHANRIGNKQSAAAKNQNTLGVLYFRIAKYDSALIYYRSAANYFEEQKDSLTSSTIYANIAIVYRNLARYEEALENAFAALSFLTNPSRTRASLYNTIASTYSKIENREKALQYHRLAIKDREAISDLQGLGKSFNNIGNVFNDLQVVDSALRYFQKSKTIKEELEDSRGLSATLNNLGNAYTKLEEYEKARDAFLTAIKIKRELKDNKGLAISLNALANTLLKSDELRSVKPLLDEAMTIAAEIKADEVIRENLDHQITYFEKSGDLTAALKASKSYRAINDKIKTQESLKNILELDTKYQSSQKDLEINYLRDLELARQKEIDLKERAIWILAISATIVLALLLTALIFLVAYRRAKNKNELLNREITHRTKNNLQILSNILNLHADKIQDNPRAQEAIRDGENRIYAMAILHDRIYKSPEQRFLNLQDYVLELTEALKSSFQLQNLKITTDIPPLEIDVNQLVSIGLIINEVITNMIKHAFTETVIPKITIEGHCKERNQFLFEISDNGKGIPEKALTNYKSFGLNLVHKLTKQLRGEINIFNDQGAHFQFSIPMTS